MKHILKFVFGLLFLTVLYHRYGGVVLIMIVPFIIYGVPALLESLAGIAKENRKGQHIEEVDAKKLLESN